MENNRIQINIYYNILSIKIESKLIIILIIILLHFNLIKKEEFKLKNNLEIKLLIAPKKCKTFINITLYFFSKFRNYSNYKIDKNFQIIKERDKHFYGSYFTDDNNYKQYKDLFRSHGFEKSKNIFDEHNLILSKNAMKLIKENRTLMKLNYFNKYFRFFNYQILMKDTLYIKYMKMKEKFNDDYNFMPETYYYPNDKNIIDKIFKNYTLNSSNLWIVKPPHGSEGKGISIFESLNNLDNKYCFLLNKYITNLDLINNKKYDLRIYALITGLKPLRIYLNKEGLVRIATNNFTLNIDSIKNKFIHLTNTDINIKNKNYIKPNSTDNEQANTWNFHTYENYLKKNKIDFDNIKNKIKDIIIKSIISVYQNLTLELVENNLNDNNFYDLLGYDIIITNDYNPILLEINTGPIIKYYNDLDKPIKSNLLVDTLNLVGISPYSKKLFNFKKNELNNNIEENVNRALCELMRPRGDYELIFPLKSNIDIYKKYLNNINSKENKLFWEIIKNESYY